MLLTLTTSSLQHVRQAKKPLAVSDMPEFVAEELELRGLNLNAALLKGMNAGDLERLRDRADRAHCPVLVLIEEAPQDFSSAAALVQTMDRVVKLGIAASKLGCPSVAIQLAGLSEDNLDTTAVSIKRTLNKLDRYEVHLLIRPATGFTADPVRLADLIKKIGGFRIGSFPSFSAAAETGDAENALRKLAPYAQAVEATIKNFSKAGKHDAWDLEKCVEAIRGVGYQNTLGIDYVGRTDPVGAISRAREVLTEAIAAGELA